MVDIQSATAEIRRGKKKKKETTGQKYNVRICYACRPVITATKIIVTKIFSFTVARIPDKSIIDGTLVYKLVS